MVTNPMKRKSKLSFFLGMLVMLVIAAVVIYFLFSRMTNLQEQLEAKQSTQKKVYVLNRDIQSGTNIEITDLTEYIVSAEDPNGTFKDIVAADGNAIAGTIAKVDLKQGTIVTTAMFYEEEVLGNDVRIQEYSSILLHSNLEVDEYIDIRLMLPNGQDYIVASKKRVEDVKESTMWLKMNEAEILTVSCATIESYIIPGSLLYTAKYVEPGMQTAAAATYSPNSQVITLMNSDPNITQVAKSELSNRISLGTTARASVNDQVNANAEMASDNIEQSVEAQIKVQQEERRKYLEDLGLIVE